MPTMEEHNDGCAQCGKMNVALLACDDPDARAKIAGIGKPRYEPQDSWPCAHCHLFRFCNDCMIGKKVRVFWPVDSSWYTGTVQEYDSSTGDHLLKYQDGDTEWVKIGENNTAAGGSSPMSGPEHQSTESQISSKNGDNKDDIQTGSDDKKWDPYGSSYFQSIPFPPSQPPGQLSSFSGVPSQMMSYGMMYGYGNPMFASGYGQSPIKSDDRNLGTESSFTRRRSGPKAWSKHEDELLLNIVHTMQWPMKWTVVAQSLPDRTGKQCRERYVNHLNPRLKVSDWTLVEDATIFHLYNLIGSHWAKMSKVIPGRTDNGIKNRFHNIRRQYEREDEHRIRLNNDAEDYSKLIYVDRVRTMPDHLLGKSATLWNMQETIRIIAAQSALDEGGTSSNRSISRFGPFEEVDGHECSRCGFLIPSLHTGRTKCTKTGWCISCTRVSPHASSNFLRECLNLRRCSLGDQREVIESWQEHRNTGRVEIE